MIFQCCIKKSISTWFADDEIKLIQKSSWNNIFLHYLYEFFKWNCVSFLNHWCPIRFNLIKNHLFSSFLELNIISEARGKLFICIEMFISNSMQILKTKNLNLKTPKQSRLTISEKMFFVVIGHPKIDQFSWKMSHLRQLYLEKLLWKQFLTKCL